MKATARGVAEFDAVTVAWTAHALARLWLAEERVAAVLACLPGLYEAWSARARVIGAWVNELWQDGVELDAAVALREGGVVAERWR